MNEGLWTLYPLPEEEMRLPSSPPGGGGGGELVCPTYLKMRGFRLSKRDGAVIIDTCDAAPGTSRTFQGLLPSGVAKI